VSLALARAELEHRADESVGEEYALPPLFYYFGCFRTRIRIL